MTTNNYINLVRAFYPEAKFRGLESHQHHKVLVFNKTDVVCVYSHVVYFTFNSPADIRYIEIKDCIEKLESDLFWD